MIKEALEYFAHLARTPRGVCIDGVEYVEDTEGEIQHPPTPKRRKMCAG